jgi:hypothetical protein
MTEQMSEFERRTSAMLETSVAKLDGATRSRLTQARYHALEQLDTSAAHTGRWRWLGRGGLLAPVAAMAGVVALTTILWVKRPDAGLLGDAGVTAAAPFDDLDLLADGDALAAMSEEDPEFYEWALAQDDAGDSAVGS